MKIRTGLLLLFCMLTGLPVAHGQGTSDKQAKKLEELHWMLGDWTFKGTWNRPDQDPEDFVYRAKNSLTLNGTRMEGRLSNSDGQLEHLMITGWEPEEEKFVAHIFWKDGSIETTELKKQGPREWKIQRNGLDGTFSDITEESFKYQATFIDPASGKEANWSFTAKKTTRNDFREIFDAWKRDFSGSYVESGKLTFAVEGLAEAGDSYVNILRLSPSANGLLTASAQFMVGDRVGPFAHGVAGWDAKDNCVSLSWYNDAGESGMLRYRPDGEGWSGDAWFIDGNKDKTTYDFVAAVTPEKIVYKKSNTQTEGKPAENIEEVWVRLKQ